MKPVVLIHPVEGEQSLMIVDISLEGCLTCLRAAEEGFSGIPFKTLCGLIEREEEVRENFRSACAFLKGESATSWPASTLSIGNWSFNDEYVKFHGRTKEDFIAKHKSDPEYLGLPRFKRKHPVTGERTDVYYHPKEGPLWVMKLGRRELCQLTSDAMPQQIYPAQGQDTLQRLEQQMEVQRDMRDVLLNWHTFQQLLEGARRQGGAKPLPGRCQPAAQPSALGAAMAAPRNAPLKLRPVSCFAPSAAQPLVQSRGREVAPQPTAPPRGPAAASVGRPFVIQRPGSVSSTASSTASLGARAPASSPSGTHKRPISPAAASPNPKLARGAASESSAASSVQSLKAPHLTIGGTGPKSKIMVLPGALPDKSPKSKSDFGSEDVSNFFADANVKDSDKFERAQVKCPVAASFAGHNLKEQLTQVKRMATTAEGLDKVELAATLLSHHNHVGLAAMFTAMSLLGPSTWPVLVDAALDLEKAKITFPKENLFHFANRHALEYFPPKGKKIDEVKFWEVADLVQDRPKVKWSVEAPSVWADIFTDEDIELQGTASFSLFITGGLFVPCMQRGQLSSQTLLKVAEIIDDKIAQYPQLLKERLEALSLKVRVIFQLYGTFPNYRGATAQDVRKQLTYKKDKFTVELNAPQSYPKQLVDGSWSLSVSEQKHWPEMERILALSREENKMPFLEDALKHYSKFKSSVRPPAVAYLQNIVSSLLAGLLNAQDFTNTDATEVQEKCRSLVILARKAQSLFSCSKLAEAFKKATDFSARLASIDMQKTMLEGADQLIAHGDEDPSVGIDTFVQSIPSDASVVVVYQDEAKGTTMANALESCLSLACENFPHQQKAVLAARSFKDRVKLDLPEGAPPLTSWDESAKFTERVFNAYAMQQGYNEYIALGSTVQGRADADPQLNAIKKVIKARKDTGFPFTQPEQSTFGGKWEAVSELDSNCSDIIAAHGGIYINARSGHVQKALDAVKPSSKGSTDGQSWKAAAQPGIKRADLYKLAQASLLQIQTDKFIPLIRDLNSERMF